MATSRNWMVALILSGGAVLAARLAGRRHARRLEAAQHKSELQAWESEGGKPQATVPRSGVADGRP